MVPGQSVLDLIVQIFINPIVILIFSLGFMMFMWGLIEFMWKSDSSTAWETGVKHMMWGVVGMFMMVAVWGIIGLIANTLGLTRGANGLWE
ncbi:MAG: hypothetical protein WAX38_00970 [Minisyncoccia bacterium]